MRWRGSRPDPHPRPRRSAGPHLPACPAGAPASPAELFAWLPAQARARRSPTPRTRRRTSPPPLPPYDTPTVAQTLVPGPLSRRLSDTTVPPQGWGATSSKTSHLTRGRTNDRGTTTYQALRKGGCRRRSLLFCPARPRDGVPRTERGREVDHHADDPRPRLAELGHGTCQRQALRRARRGEARGRPPGGQLLARHEPAARNRCSAFG